jgi:hypothetical protein
LPAELLSVEDDPSKSGHGFERRGRSFKIWAWIAVIVGPLGLLLLVFLFPKLHGKDSDRA